MRKASLSHDLEVFILSLKNFFGKLFHRVTRRRLKTFYSHIRSSTMLEQFLGMHSESVHIGAGKKSSAGPEEDRLTMGNRSPLSCDLPEVTYQNRPDVKGTDYRKGRKFVSWPSSAFARAYLSLDSPECTIKTLCAITG